MGTRVNATKISPLVGCDSGESSRLAGGFLWRGPGLKDMPDRKDDKDPVKLALDAFHLNTKAMKAQFATWREAADSFKGKRSVTEPRKANIMLNRLVKDVETVVPRYTSNLMGSRPYLPFRSNKREYSDWASGIEDLIDYFCDESRGRFFMSMDQALRYAIPLGIGYVEPRYEWWPYNIYQRVSKYDNFGRSIGEDIFETTEIQEGMRFVVHHPAAVRPHPHGRSLSEKPDIVIVEMVATADIERLIEQGTYKMPDGFDKADLRKRQSPDTEIAKELSYDKRDMSSEMADSVGVLMRYHADNRWIALWNGAIPLLDTENQNRNMFRWQKPITAIRNMSHIGPDTWWPIGMYERGKELAEWGSKIVSRYFQDVMMSSAQMIAYDPDLVSREDLVAEPGNRIPIQGGQFDRAFKRIDLATPHKELFDLYDITKGELDEIQGLYDYQRGSTPARKETATATTALTTAGNTRLESGILYIEQTGFADSAYIAAKTVDANVTRGMADDILGFERASGMPSFDPDMIPGGWSVHFEGSDRVQRKAQKTETYIETYNMLRPQVPRNAWVMDRKLALLTEVHTEQELDMLGLSDRGQEEMADEAAQQAAMQPAAPPPGPGPTMGPSGGIVPPNQIPTPEMNIATGV